MIKKTNPKISAKLLSLKGGIEELILALGYIQVLITYLHLLVRWRILHIYRWLLPSFEKVFLTYKRETNEGQV